MPAENLTDVCLSDERARLCTSAYETRLLEEIRLNQETGGCDENFKYSWSVIRFNQYPHAAEFFLLLCACI